MTGLLVDENYDLQVSVKKNSKGLITQGLILGNINYQRCGFIIVMHKGEFKEYPTLGLGIDKYLKKTISAHEKQKFITELKSELSSDGMNARIRITGNDISKFTIDI